MSHTLRITGRYTTKYSKYITNHINTCDTHKNYSDDAILKLISPHNTNFYQSFVLFYAKPTNFIQSIFFNKQPDRISYAILLERFNKWISCGEDYETVDPKWFEQDLLVNYPKYTKINPDFIRCSCVYDLKLHRDMCQQYKLENNVWLWSAYDKLSNTDFLSCVSVDKSIEDAFRTTVDECEPYKSIIKPISIFDIPIRQRNQTRDMRIYIDTLDSCKNKILYTTHDYRYSFTYIMNKIPKSHQSEMNNILKITDNDLACILCDDRVIVLEPRLVMQDGKFKFLQTEFVSVACQTCNKLIGLVDPMAKNLICLRHVKTKYYLLWIMLRNVNFDILNQIMLKFMTVTTAFLAQEVLS